MAHRVPRRLHLPLLIGFGVLATSLPNWSLGTGQPNGRGLDRVVYLAGGLSDEGIISLTANVAASGNSGVVLIDSTKWTEQQKQFVQKFQPERIVPVGTFPDGIAVLEQRFAVKVSPVVPWTRGPPLALWKDLFPRAERVVLCPSEPRPQLLQAACLAGVLKSPLCLTTGQPGENVLLHQQLIEWNIREIYAVGDAAKLIPKLDPRGDGPRPKLIHLRDAEMVASVHRRFLRQQGPIESLVVANPTDGQRGLTNLSPLAPWIAIQRRAALLLTSDKGDDAGEIIQQALRTRDLRHAESLILLGDLTALPMERRTNPVAGKDAYIEMEPLTPSGNDSFMGQRGC